MKLKNIDISKSKYMVPIIVCIILIIGIVIGCFFSSLISGEKTQYVLIDTDDNIDSVFNKVQSLENSGGAIGFRTLMRHSNYKDNIRTGRYEIKPGDSNFKIFRKIKNGQQTPFNLTIPSVRTLDRLAEELSAKMMMSSDEVYEALTNEDNLKKYGYDENTIISMFIPNTYEVFWNTPVEKFLDRMEKESKAFWNEERCKKATELGMTPVEVMTLASIIDEETANNAEKPMIAGMYYNRLKKGMPLQADPTIKFAMKNFEARRIYHNWLTTDSPFNTYMHTGLTPGPIRIPSIAGIDAVLNMVHHNYVYMCAKEDFSGTHNFAETYAEHMQNARKYSAALNERGIK